MPEHPQRDRTRQLWLLPREGTPQSQPVAEVAIRVRTMQTYTYAIPTEMHDRVRPGVAVTVPYGRAQRIVAGWCLRVDSLDWKSTRKPIATVSDEPPILSPQLIELALWVSRYYACPPATVIEALVPSAIRAPRMHSVRYLVAVERDADAAPLAQRDAEYLQMFGSERRRRRDVRRETGLSAAIVRRLVRSGLLVEENRVEPARPRKANPIAREFDAAAGLIEDGFSLTEAQQTALDAILQRLTPQPRFGVSLLFGVPGSGKTEVYVRAMRRAVDSGMQAILLIPEIALATQIVARVRRRFARVLVLHSRLPTAERVAALRSIAAGDVDVVIGTRSALFAPCPRLGLIIVDEEQESSFKSLAAPYYHARDVAIKRAQIEGLPIVLGSATPSLETWQNARDKRFELLRLPTRATGAATPKTELVDVRAGRDGDSPLLSARLRHELITTVAGGQQAVLLLNRRGYAARLRCVRCGLLVACARCGIQLIEHRSAGCMKCHRCGTRTPIPERCLDASCSGALERTGYAIQRLEEELDRAVPQARLLRLDRDTMRRRADYDDALHQFEAREADILLGTQMVAKGLDFPGVRLVGVLDADALLALADFRAAEHAFQLITQVVGRAGRQAGESLALIQTASPDHPVLGCALRLDYESFAAAELEVRRELSYPPFGRLIRLICADERPKAARVAAESLSADLRQLAQSVSAAIRVLDAQLCHASRVRGRTRYEVLIRTPRDDSGQRLLTEAFARKLLSRSVQRLTIDVDPQDMS